MIESPPTHVDYILPPKIMIAPVPAVSRPYTNCIRHNLRLHRTLFLLHARPVMDNLSRDETYGEYGFEYVWQYYHQRELPVDLSCWLLSDVELYATEPLERYLADLRKTARAPITLDLEVLDPRLAEPDADFVVGWNLHPAAANCLAVAEAASESAATLLAKKPGKEVDGLLGQVRHMTPAPNHPTGSDNGGLIGWDWPEQMTALINSLEPVESFEQQLVAGGWKPELHEVWSLPMTQTELLDRLFPESKPKPARDWHRKIADFYPVKPGDGGLWQICMDSMAPEIRHRLEIPRNVTFEKVQIRTHTANASIRID